MREAGRGKAGTRMGMLSACNTGAGKTVTRIEAVQVAAGRAIIAGFDTGDMDLAGTVDASGSIARFGTADMGPGHRGKMAAAGAYFGGTADSAAVAIESLFAVFAAVEPLTLLRTPGTGSFFDAAILLMSHERFSDALMSRIPETEQRFDALMSRIPETEQFSDARMSLIPETGRFLDALVSRIPGPVQGFDALDFRIPGAARVLSSAKAHFLFAATGFVGSSRAANFVPVETMAAAWD